MTSVGGSGSLPAGHVRAMDPFRDLGAVVDLIAVAFGSRIDPAGKATLRRMRRFAQRGPLLQWMWVVLGKATFAPGLLWVVNDTVVGNVSIRRARGTNGFLIGNVVVHPERRGRGIATALMRRALKVVSRQGAAWVGLEVRTDNQAARGLYERFGFEEVGRTRHFLRDVCVGPAEGPKRGDTIRRGRPSDGDALVELSRVTVPAEQRPLLELPKADYRPGLGRRLQHWLSGENERWWVVPASGSVEGAVRTIRRRGGYPHTLEVLTRPGLQRAMRIDLVRRGVHSLGSSARKPIEASLPGVSNPLADVMIEEGFRELRVLIQMKRTLSGMISVKVKARA